MSGVEMLGVELSGVEMSTFGIKIGYYNPRSYNRIYCVIPGVEISGVEMFSSPNYDHLKSYKSMCVNFIDCIIKLKEINGKVTNIHHL